MWLVVALTSSESSTALAQEQNTVSVVRARRAVTYDGGSPLQALRRHVEAGDEAAAKQLAREMVQTLRQYPEFNGCCTDNGVVRVLFTATDATGTRILARVVFGADRRTGYLRGIHGTDHPVDDLFISEDAQSRLTSTFKLVAEEDPALAQAADLAKSILSGAALGGSTAIRGGPQVALIGSIPAGAWAEIRLEAEVDREPVLVTRPDLTEPSGATLQVESLPRRPRRQIHVEWRGTELEHERGTLSIADQMTVENSVASLRAATGDLAEEIAVAPNIDACGKAVAVRARDGIIQATYDEACWPGRLAAPAECLTKLRMAVAAALEPPPDSPSAACEADRFRVAKMFEGTVVALPGPVAAESTFKNVAVSRFSLGLGTAVLGWARVPAGRARVQMQNGKVAIATIPRTTGLAVLNWHPWPFMARPAEMAGLRESFRVFGAVGIAPSFGAGAGLGAGITRQIALNAGVLWLLADTADVTRVGTEPTDPKPFEAGWIFAPFIGASFRLK